MITDRSKAGDEPRIITHCNYPPIPDRQFDWCAYRDGYEPPDVNGEGGGSHVGYGRTEAAAIQDLLNLEEWDTPA